MLRIVKIKLIRYALRHDRFLLLSLVKFWPLAFGALVCSWLAMDATPDQRFRRWVSVPVAAGYWFIYSYYDSKSLMRRHEWRELLRSRRREMQD
ncbi:hypothetical protein D3C86_1658770 [compost metagenome]